MHPIKTFSVYVYDSMPQYTVTVAVSTVLFYKLLLYWITWFCVCVCSICGRHLWSEPNSGAGIEYVTVINAKWNVWQ